MDFTFYQTLFARLSISLESYWSSAAGNIASGIAPVATTLMCLYLVFWGLAVMRGAVNEPVMDGALRMVRMAFIVTLAINAGIYNSYLANLLWQTPDALAGIVAGGTGGSSMHFLDSLMGQFYGLAQAFSDKAYADAGLTGLPDLSLWAASWAILIGGSALTGYAAFLFALSKIALAILLGIGGIFILMTLFDATRRFFDVWIGQCLNYVFLVLLTASGVKLVMTIISSYMTAALLAASDPSIVQAMPALIFSLIGMLVLMQLPAIASALGGGVAIGTLGAASHAWARTKGGISAMRPTSLQRTANTLRADARIASKTVGRVTSVFR